MQISESETLELKRSTAELGEALKSIVAILNKHQAGDLYFGFRDNGVEVGQDVSQKTLRCIAQAIDQKIEPKIFPKITGVNIGGKDCVHVQYEGVQVPYFYEGRAYLRVADQDRQITVHELRKLFGEQISKDWEKQPSEKSIKDVDSKTLKDFMRHAKAASRINFSYSNAGTTLHKLGLTRNGKLLRAGEVLFCNDNRMEVQAAVFAGNDKLTFLDIRQIKGNLFGLLVKCRSYLWDHIDWRGKLSGEGRREIPEIPTRALEEALVNSVIHRDYANLKSNEISIFKDRIEVYNPGEYLPSASPQEFVKGQERSVLRNPLIAEAMYNANATERWGSGFKRIYDECKKAGVKVEFNEVKTGFVVVFHRKRAVSEQAEAPESPGKSQKSTRKVPEKYQKLLKAIISDSKISRDALAQKTGVPAGTILSGLRWLVKNGILRRVGPARGGYWEFIKTKDNWE
ncbi:MAG: ATP-binding protein [Candidatus Micrarchaeota archaeon]